MNSPSVEVQCTKFDFCFSFQTDDIFIVHELYDIALSAGYFPYFYQEELARQSGHKIKDLASELYRNRPAVVVAGSNYGRTENTRNELSHILSYLEKYDDAKAILVRTEVKSSADKNLECLSAYDNKVKSLIIGSEFSKTRRKFSELLRNGYLGKKTNSSPTIVRQPQS